MKHVVMTSETRASDIRPPELLRRFRELTVAEADRCFPVDSRVDVPCPACGSEAGEAAFDRHGFTYRRCAACRSLYVSPRPTTEAIGAYYQDSEASAFRKEYLTAETPERRAILRERALWIGRIVDETHEAAAGVFADFGTIYPHFVEEVTGLGLFTEVQSVDPSPAAHLSILRAKARVVNPEPGSLSAVSAFEQLEHQGSPRAFLERIFQSLEPAGVLFLTSRTCDGFDLQVLQEHAGYIFVPEHLNLLSIAGVTRLLEEVGFRVLEMSTPGHLDVELVLQAIQEDPSVAPPFLHHLLGSSEDARADLQQLLQRHRLSSHLRIAAIR
jgi:hypothetical protein